MAKANKDKQAEFRQRQKALGYVRKEFWVTLSEYKAVKQFLADKRGE